MVTGCDRAVICALIGGRRTEIYEVAAHHDLQARFVVAARAFLGARRERRVPPDVDHGKHVAEAGGAVAYELATEEGQRIALLTKRADMLAAQIKALESEADDVRAEIKAAIGTRSTATVEGLGGWSYKTSSRVTYREAAGREAHPRCRVCAGADAPAQQGAQQVTKGNPQGQPATARRTRDRQPGAGFVARAVPKGVDAEHITLALNVALRNTPGLVDCDLGSLYAAVSPDRRARPSPRRSARPRLPDPAQQAGATDRGLPRHGAARGRRRRRHLDPRQRGRAWRRLRVARGPDAGAGPHADEPAPAAADITHAYAIAELPAAAVRGWC